MSISSRGRINFMLNTHSIVVTGSRHQFRVISTLTSAESLCTTSTAAPCTMYPYRTSIDRILNTL